MPTSKKRLLFVCVGNSCRSQMAEGFARAYGGDDVEVFSAGTSPAGRISAGAIEAMKEKGIDIRQQRSKALDEVDLNNMDVVVTMGCCSASSVCPVSFRGKRIDWDIDDPVGQPIDVFRKVRDHIEDQVKELVDGIVRTKSV